MQFLQQTHFAHRQHDDAHGGKWNGTDTLGISNAFASVTGQILVN